MNADRFDALVKRMLTRRAAFAVAAVGAVAGRGAPAAAKRPLRDCTRKKKYVCPPEQDCVRTGRRKHRKWTCVVRPQPGPGGECKPEIEVKCPNGECAPVCSSRPDYFCKRFFYCVEHLDQDCDAWMGCQGELVGCHGPNTFHGNWCDEIEPSAGAGAARGR